MTMPAKMKLRLLEAATLVVHVAIEHIDAPDIPKGKLAVGTVTGKVRRVFVGNYEFDTPISFRMTVYSESPPPGDCYQNVHKLRATDFIEAYLEKDADEPGMWNAIDTSLIEEIREEPIQITRLRQTVGQNNPEEKIPESNLTKLWKRLLGRA